MEFLYRTRHAKEVQGPRRISQEEIDQIVGMPHDHWQQEDNTLVFIGVAGHRKLTVIRRFDGTIITAYPGWARKP